ncbi:MAG: hypothetical protein DRR04_10410 [Gammaproteobacteria bacterium]|nr:MAG: hypothetical protein DRR04_10410 [Gammaproteobacteria bacterium]
MAYYSDVVFDGNDLTAITNIKIIGVALDILPKVVLSRGKLSRQDGAKIYNKEFGGKKIIVTGLITTEDREDYLSARTELLGNLDGVEKTLSVIIGDLPLEYTATLDNVTINDSSGGYGSFTIDFACSGLYGRDRDTRVLVDGGTVSTTPEDITLSETIGGSVKTPPRIVLTVLSVTGGTDAYIRVSNSKAEEIRITRTWAVDDQLILDMETKICTVNGIAHDYAGFFWSLAVGDTEVTYSDSLTTRSIGVQITYKRRYL